MHISYEVKKTMVVITLVFYCAAGIFIRLYRDEQHHQIYPFFSWYLFANIPIPNQQVTFTMDILSLGSQTYNPPLPFSQTSSIFQKLRQSPTEYTALIVMLGQSILSGDANSISQSRQKLEKIFLGTSARYEILRVNYDPVAYWENGTYTSESVIGTFQTPGK